MEHFVAGTTARTAAALCGVNRKTAAYFYHRLREIISYEMEAEADDIFDGEIEVDESYFGGRRGGDGWWRAPPGSQNFSCWRRTATMRLPAAMA